MRQVQLINVLQGTENYNKVCFKGFLGKDKKYYYLYDLHVVDRLFTVWVNGMNPLNYKVEETNTLTEKEFELLTKFESYTVALRKYNGVIKNFEDQGESLYESRESLTLLEIVDGYVLLEKQRAKYLKAIEKVNKFTRKLNEVYFIMSNLTYINSNYTVKELVKMIKNETGAGIKGNRLGFTFSGKLPFKKVSKLVLQNGKTYNKENLLVAQVTITGVTNDLYAGIQLTYSYDNTLQFGTAKKVIIAFNEAVAVFGNKMDVIVGE